jgi:hypothetical protein
MSLIANDKKFKYEKVGGEFRSEQSLGSVFGVCCADTRLWSFYYQRLILVSFYRKAGTDTNPQFVFAREDWRCLTCDMF